MLYDPFSENWCVDFYLLKYWGESYVRVIGIAKVAKYDEFLLQYYLSDFLYVKCSYDFQKNLLY